ncbi:hypothetical protein VP14_044 [Vibrio phage VPMCC14]|nr:hypothetical protein VP14_044 [Vibrio phage VPMCC14]
MEHKTFKAKVRVYSVEGKNYLLYKYKGKYYPISLVREDQVEETGMDVHTEPCAYKAAMVTQNQYAPFYSRQLKELGKKSFKLLTVFSL